MAVTSNKYVLNSYDATFFDAQGRSRPIYSYPYGEGMVFLIGQESWLSRPERLEKTEEVLGLDARIYDELLLK